MAGAGSEDEAEDWTRRRLVVGRDEASCQPVDDAGRSADGDVMRRRVGTLGAEVDVGAEARLRPGAGAGEDERDAEVVVEDGYWYEAPTGGVEEAGEAEDAGTVCPVGSAVLRRVGASGAPGDRWLPEVGAGV